MLATELSERSGQNVIVQNRPGAGSMIGTEHVAKSVESEVAGCKRVVAEEKIEVQ